MIRKIIFVLSITIRVLIGQEFLVFDPQQLGMSTSTARVSSHQYAGSGLAQYFFNNSTLVDVSLYLPYLELSDGKMRTNSIQFYLPSYRWGALRFAYGQFYVENLTKQVHSNSMIQLGYTGSPFNRLLVAANGKWNQLRWYSDVYSPIMASGFNLDLSAIYILNGYSSIGLSIRNVFNNTYSAYKNDGDIQSLRFAYQRINMKTTLSLEAGIAVEEDYYFNHKWGGFLSGEYTILDGLVVGAEYRRLFHNEFGGLVSFNYDTGNYAVQFSYGIRIDDAPLPVSTLKHALGVRFGLNKFRPKSISINPQILLRDDMAPDLFTKRISDYKILTYSDASDLLRIQMSIKDDYSGLSSYGLRITPYQEEDNILYEKQYVLQGNAYEDTLTFNGIAENGELLSNNKYLAVIAVKDKAGNESVSAGIPFAILSPKNDMAAPFIDFSFDTTKVMLDSTQIEYSLYARLTIDDRESNWILWRAQLLRSDDGINWQNLKAHNGGIEVQDELLQWSFNRLTVGCLGGRYKIRFEANDELSNHAVVWSGVKEIEDLDCRELVPPVQQIADVENIPYHDKPESKAIIDTIRDSGYELAASYVYGKNEIKLSNFVFVNNSNNLNYNRQSLAIIGVYLLDIKNSRLRIEYPNNLKNRLGFVSHINNFFQEAYGVNSNRISFYAVSKRNAIRFIIDE
jgi:hypothetical protein